jgi:hypothetical protein
MARSQTSSLAEFLCRGFTVKGADVTLSSELGDSELKKAETVLHCRACD